MTASTEGERDKATAQLLATAETAEAAGDLDRSLGYFRALGEIEPRNPRWALEAIRVLRKSERHKESDDALRQSLRKWPKLIQSDLFKRTLPDVVPTGDNQRQALGEDCPPDAALKRTPVEDDGYSDCIVARGGRKAAVVVFTGLADRMVMPLPLFDRYLAELDLTAIYLRDPKRIGYFHGVEALGADYEHTIERLKELLVDFDAATVHTIGNSAGGMAAVSYGLDLGARRVLTFSAPLALTTETGRFDSRANVFLNRLLTLVPDERRHLRERLMAAEGRTEIHLYYGADMPEDRTHAEAMAEAPGVTLHPITGLAGHGALFRMAEQHGLRKLLTEMFGDKD